MAIEQKGTQRINFHLLNVDGKHISGVKFLFRRLMTETITQEGMEGVGGGNQLEIRPWTQAYRLEINYAAMQQCSYQNFWQISNRCIAILLGVGGIRRGVL